MPNKAIEKDHKTNALKSDQIKFNFKNFNDSFINGS